MMIFYLVKAGKRRDKKNLPRLFRINAEEMIIQTDLNPCLKLVVLISMIINIVSNPVYNICSKVNFMK